MTNGANATFGDMVHSIQIISPIEDFDEKELRAWEQLMQLEGRSELDELPPRSDSDLAPSIGDDQVHRQRVAYCFTRVTLVSSSLLLAGVVVILSMSLTLVTKHLMNRADSEKEVYLS